MIINEYQELAMRTNDGKCTERLYDFINMYRTLKDDYDNEDILHILGFNPGELINGCFGLTGETGEFVDQIKKFIFHEHDFNFDNLVKELGDVCWYLALLCNALGIQLEDVMRENIEKLKRRYPEGFSSEASINREE